MEATEGVPTRRMDMHGLFLDSTMYTCWDVAFLLQVKIFLVCVLLPDTGVWSIRRAAASRKFYETSEGCLHA